MSSLPDVLTVSWLIILLFMVSLPLATARMDFECVFGDIVKTTDSQGKPLRFCPTNMDPPFMQEGDFILAHQKDRCFECVCEEDVGLACCDCPRVKRG